MMSIMSYKAASIQNLRELGAEVASARKGARQTATAVARRSGRSRDILHRLEHGEDVAVSSLLDILNAMGFQLALVPSRLPTLEEARNRFADED